MRFCPMSSRTTYPPLTISTWSLTNSFIAKKRISQEEGKENINYREIAWVKFSQDYDIKTERDKNPATRTWSDIRMESELHPTSLFSVDTDVDFDPYNSHFTKINFGGTLKDRRGDYVTTEYRYTLESSETWYTKILGQISKSFGIYFSFEQDLEKRQTIETRTGLFLDRPCWDLDLQYKESSDSRKILFLITLEGIGEFGQK